MISLGPEFATDLSAIDAAPAPAGGAAPFAEQDADLFNAVLGQMMGQDGFALDGSAAGEDGDAPLEDEADTAAGVDPTELVNPMFVEGAAPVVQIAPAATFVWSIPPVAAPTDALPADATGPSSSTLNEFAAVDSPAGMPPPGDMPPSSSFDAMLKGGAKADLPDETALASTLKPRATESMPDATMALEAAVAAEPLADAIAPVKDREPRSEFASQIADAINKQERSAKSAKAERGPAEPKIDGAGLRPLPFVAVERAYAGNDQGASKSFDSPREQASFGTASQGAQPSFSNTPTPTFVVPADGRTMLNMQAAPAVSAAEVPASVARDIDTHVPAQIVQSIRLQANNGGGEAIIRLNPDYLGEVVVAVKVEQGSVVAALQAETPAVRQWAERNESVLRQALAEQGLQLDRLTVAEKASETERESAHDGAREDAREEHSQHQPRRRRPQSDEATFEVTV